MTVRTKTVLLVDDSSTARMIESLLLKQKGYRLLEAHDGAEGVEVARRESPDLILMDVSMPKLDGFQALAQIRSDPKTKAIPVIMITTRAELEHVHRGYEAGCSEYLTKPINGAELLQRVEKYLGS